MVQKYPEVTINMYQLKIIHDFKTTTGHGLRIFPEYYWFEKEDRGQKTTTGYTAIATMLNF